MGRRRSVEGKKSRCRKVGATWVWRSGDARRYFGRGAREVRRSRWSPKVGSVVPESGRHNRCGRDGASRGAVPGRVFHVKRPPSPRVSDGRGDVQCAVVPAVNGPAGEGRGCHREMGLPRSIRPPDPRPQEVASGRALLPPVASAPVPPAHRPHGRGLAETGAEGLNAGLVRRSSSSVPGTSSRPRRRRPCHRGAGMNRGLERGCLERA